jgi:hypothetical protein
MMYGRNYFTASHLNILYCAYMLCQVFHLTFAVFKRSNKNTEHYLLGCGIMFYVNLDERHVTQYTKRYDTVHTYTRISCILAVYILTISAYAMPTVL